MRGDRQLTVHVMGEFTFSCSLIEKLRKMALNVLLLVPNGRLKLWVIV